MDVGDICISTMPSILELQNEIADVQNHATATPITTRTDGTRRELVIVDIPTDKSLYLHTVFPLPGIRPPIVHGAERNSNGFYHLYAPPSNDDTAIGADEHWCLYRSKNEVIPKYKDRVHRWYDFSIGAVQYHVAVCK